MTIELLDLDVLPNGLASAAYTMVAVQSASGPVRYRAVISPAAGTPGPAGQGLTFRGGWAAATAYAAYDVLTYGGSAYLVSSAFTSGQSFATTNLALLASKGDPGTGGGSTPIATTSSAGTIKPDGTTLTVAGDGTTSVVGVAFSGVPAATSLSATDGAVINQGGVDKSETRAQALAWLQANWGDVDPSQAPVATTWSQVAMLIGFASDGSVLRVPPSLVPTSSSGSSGSSGSTATAPSQVGSLAAGTPTSTTVPLTWTAPTGTAPITYTVNVAPHGSSTFAAATGTFSGTGGTVTGLTASTSYDFQVVATNSAGSSTTTLTTGVSTAAGAATPSPGALTVTNAVYADRGDGSGKKMLVGGTAVGQITLPSGTNGFNLLMKAKYNGAEPSRSQPFIKVTNSTGDYVGLISNGGNLAMASKAYTDGGGNASDTAIHALAIKFFSGYAQSFLDNNRTAQAGGQDTNFTNDTPAQIAIDMSLAPPGLFSVQIWSEDGYSSSVALQGTYEFDGNGNLS